MSVIKEIKIAITGASGFIGKNLVSFLAIEGTNFNIIGIDLYPSPLRYSNYEHVQVDISNDNKLFKTLVDFKPQWIIHLAANADLNSSEISDLSVNWTPIKVIKLAQNSIETCSVVYFSSMLAEKSNSKTASKVYGHSKYLMERECLDSDNKDFIILRPSTVWGLYHERWISEFVRAARFRYIFKIKNINPMRYFCYVDNISIYILQLVTFGIPFELKGQSFFVSDPPINLHKYIDTFTQHIFGYKPFELPYLFMIILARLGDALAYLKIKFPLTLFRLKNMSTDMFLPEKKIVMCKSANRLKLVDSCKDFKTKYPSI